MPRVVVVIPLRPLRVGARFAVRDWPLHVTVVPPFTTGSMPADVARVIAETAAGVPPLQVRAGRSAMFGRRHDVPVTLIEDDGRLSGLHVALVDALRPLASSPGDRAFQQGPFRPHVTVKGERHATEGEALILAQVALVDMAPRSSPGGREVLATTALTAARD